MPRPLSTGQDSTYLAMLCCTAEGWEGLTGHWGQAGEGCPKPCPHLALGCQGDTVPFPACCPISPGCGAALPGSLGGSRHGACGQERRGLGALLLPSPCR